MKKKVYIRTYGCQMNDRDTELIAGMLTEKGCSLVESPEEADVILFNTCSVRQHAEDRVSGNLFEMAKLKKKNPGLKIGVLGCMAQRHGEELFKGHPEVDIVVGPRNIYDIPDLLLRSGSGEKILAVDNLKRPNKNVNTGYRTGVFSAFVNIMYGCDNFCSYCIVPHVRGREVSRPKQDILDEVKMLADKGFKEVNLLGQNVNSYGRGLDSEIKFPELLEEVNKLDGIERIRFTTSHPKDAGKDLFEAMRDLDKVCESLHLPMQSGSDRMLELMNRRYKYSDYSEKIGLFRDIVPGSSVGTDIIVGFPSEDDKDFMATRGAMTDIGFRSAFIFKYSPRPPAESASMEDDVPLKIKKERNNDLLELQKNISHDINKGMIGTVQEVLVESKSRMSETELTGRTRNNTPCVFPGGAELIGKTVRVNVNGTSPSTLKGNLITNAE